MREGEGTWLGHVLEHVAIELQNVAGEDVTFGKTRSIADDRPGVYSVVYEYAQKEEGIAAGELALKLLDSLLPAELRSATDESWNWDEERDAFIRYAQRRALGPSTASLVKAAVDRGIPWLRLNEQSLVQLGQGVAELTGAAGGGGAGFLGRLRQTLGLDQLRVGAPNTSSGPNASNSPVSIEAGRYVAPGVYVGARQGAAGNSSRGVVEIQVFDNTKIEGDIGADSNGRVGVKMEWDY